MSIPRKNREMVLSLNGQYGRLILGSVDRGGPDLSSVCFRKECEVLIYMLFSKRFLKNSNRLRPHSADSMDIG